MSGRRVLPPGLNHHEIELTFRQTAPNRSHADSPPEKFAVRGRAGVQCQPRQSRRQSQCDNLSSTAGFYRRPDLMQTSRTNIHISIRDQRLTLKDGETPIRTYPISTSRFGIGTEEGSMKTPTGQFRVAEKIGGEMPGETVFRNRVALGPDDPLPPTEDLVMSRILWLDGLDEHNANTRDRFIYIHGTKHEDKIGNPASHGCVRMRNSDVVELFELVDEGARVTIEE